MQILTLLANCRFTHQCTNLCKTLIKLYNIFGNVSELNLDRIELLASHHRKWISISPLKHKSFETKIQKKKGAIIRIYDEQHIKKGTIHFREKVKVGYRFYFHVFMMTINFERSIATRMISGLEKLSMLSKRYRHFWLTMQNSKRKRLLKLSNWINLTRSFPRTIIIQKK